MGINWGALAGGIGSGAAQGIKMMTEIEEAGYRKDAHQWAKDEQEQKKLVREAQKAYAQGIDALKKERQSGTGSFSQFITPEVAKAREAESSGAIATPGQVESKAYGSKNPLMDGGEGLYRNQALADDHYYSRLKDLQERLYSVTDPSKLPMVSEEIEALRERGYDRTRKAATVALMAGAPNALDLANRAYGFQKDGMQIDTRSGTFDPEKGWSGVNIVDQSGQTVRSISLTQNDILKMYLSGTPDKLATFNIQSRQADSAEMSAKASQTSANAAVTTANARAALVDSENYKNRQIGDWYGAGKLAQAQAVNDQRIEKLFEPFAKPQAVDPNLPRDQQARITDSNNMLAAQKGMASELWRNPLNAKVGNPGSIWNAAGQLMNLQPSQLSDGTMGIDPRMYFKETPNPDFVLYQDPKNPSIKAVIPKEGAMQLMQAAQARYQRQQ